MADKTLEGKVALITGSSKGIGKATALRLASQGASLVINYSSDEVSANEVVDQIGSDRAIAIKADVSNLTGIDDLVKRTVQRFGKIDILIPNAAMLPMKDIETTTEEDFDRCMALNVKGPYFLVQKSLPYMAEGSHVVLLSSTLCVASTVTPNYLLYLTSKGSIEQMTRLMAKQLGAKRISVNAIAPGPTSTELFLKDKPEQLVQMLAGLNPQKRLGKPEEIAEAISFLSTSSWVSGQVVRVNGAMA